MRGLLYTLLFYNTSVGVFLIFNTYHICMATYCIKFAEPYDKFKSENLEQAKFNLLKV